MIKTIKTSIVVFLTLCLVLGALAFAFSFHSAPAPASAHSTLAAVTGTHISLDPQEVHTPASFSVFVTGSNFQPGAVLEFDWDGEVGAASSYGMCDSVLVGTTPIDSDPLVTVQSDGTFGADLFFTDCRTNTVSLDVVTVAGQRYASTLDIDS